VLHQHAETAADTGYCLSTQATAANIRQVNAEELEAAIAARDKPIVVDFFATCTSYCQMIAGCAVLASCGRRTKHWAAVDCRVWTMPAAGTGAGKGELLCWSRCCVCIPVVCCGNLMLAGAVPSLHRK
jgi:hypothetical protein